MEKHIETIQEGSTKGDYIMPPLSLLNETDNITPAITQEELEKNKKIIEKILDSYGIDIDKIEVTPNLSFSLYEIFPLPNVRLSEIKVVNDHSNNSIGTAVAFISDSASKAGILKLSDFEADINKEFGFLPNLYSIVYLNKREKITLSIEIPNKSLQVIPMRSLLSSEEFQNSNYILPCAIGKNISNETHVFDLSKAPHVIIDGSEDKEKGVNAIITSLLYSKHPSELKFVIIDQKDNYTLYNNIGSHYFAKLPYPHKEEAVISYTKEVVRTLNSLCLEMNARHKLLKAAECYNITEYNERFKSSELQPNEGHRFLPHIVVVIDEIANILTECRDAETQIARLVQFAGTIGIHIIATTRFPYNISYALIRIPIRIVFKIGNGDMILCSSNGRIRLQCGFVGNAEIKRITKFIGEQSDYSEPYLLPVAPENNDNSKP